MNEETYEALKLVLKHATQGGSNDAEFWDAVKQVEAWIDEVAKEYQEDEPQGWSECNHYVTDDRGLCLRCGYNTLHLTMKEFNKLKV